MSEGLTKEYFIEFRFPVETFLELQNLEFSRFLTLTALEGFPFIPNINGEKISHYVMNNHYGFKVTLPISYEKELEKTLQGTGFTIIN